MSFTLTGALTGATITGFTTPGYTLTADNAPDVRSKQSIVSQITGSQLGVVVHTTNAPFSVLVRRPGSLRAGSQALLNGVTGVLSKVPYNEFLILTRKAAQVATNQWWTNEMRTTAKVFAGTETFDAPNLKALVCAHVGFLSANAQGVVDTCTNGVL